ncbi:unnamed protein product [Dovyalis caffra]|uniref:Uncharacterized protein n=1 Tax=Dovyalis caffra TaxID=77055 RepID=A0AAV1SEE1_9ROSI|nr:unnamed protein product [Dovyalis caffra]
MAKAAVTSWYMDMILLFVEQKKWEQAIAAVATKDAKVIEAAAKINAKNPKRRKNIYCI